MAAPLQFFRMVLIFCGNSDFARTGIYLFRPCKTVRSSRVCTACTRPQRQNSSLSRGRTLGFLKNCIKAHQYMQETGGRKASSRLLQSSAHGQGGWYDQWPDSSEIDTASGAGRVLHGAACDPSSGTRTIVAHPLRKSNAKSINICGISCWFASGSIARRGMHHRCASGFFIFLSTWSAAAKSASDTARAARTAYRVSGRSWPAARTRQNSPQGRPARVRGRCY